MTWYDRAQLYDRAFSWDATPEREFVLEASRRYGIATPRRILEPFCGSGRLLPGLPGLVVGSDINAAMLRIARERAAVVRGDACDCPWRKGSFDLAFNLIDSFRHLLTEERAARHLSSIGRALAPGAIYVLGLDVTGDLPGDVSFEKWDRHGVSCCVGGFGDADPSSRLETLHAQLTAAGEVVEEFYPMRVYGTRDLEDLIDGEGSFEIAGVFDRHYDLDRSIELSEVCGSAVLVLRRE